jgi:hypothetical protein
MQEDADEPDRRRERQECGDLIEDGLTDELDH